MALDPHEASPHRGSPGSRPADDEPLPCGAMLAEVWDEGRPQADHVTCVHCRAAVEQLDVLHSVVADALGVELLEPSVRDDVAAGVTERIMAVVRTELRPGPQVPLGTVADAARDGADDWITEAAAARVLREAAERQHGVSAGSCRIRSAGGSDRVVGGGRLPRGPLRIRLEIAVTPVAALHDTAERVRRRVAAATDEDLGLDVAAIDVFVVDLHDRAPAFPRRRHLR